MPLVSALAVFTICSAFSQLLGHSVTEHRALLRVDSSGHLIQTSKGTNGRTRISRIAERSELQGATCKPFETGGCRMNDDPNAEPPRTFGATSEIECVRDCKQTQVHDPDLACCQWCPDGSICGGEVGCRSYINATLGDNHNIKGSLCQPYVPVPGELMPQ
mmetsp:Transcript_42141/g.66820  ORF Transcript_42141/g.66820 Transcript_42141/m.66820 type:complete len:161 (+) Transcript_42141:104-586(+)